MCFSVDVRFAAGTRGRWATTVGMDADGERTRYIVAVAHPPTDVARTDDIANWRTPELSRQCLDSMHLVGLPFRINHSIGDRLVAGTIIDDVQTPHAIDGRRVCVARVDDDTLEGAVASRYSEDGVMRHVSLRHENETVVDRLPDGSTRRYRVSRPQEVSLTHDPYRKGCDVLGIFRRRPTTTEVDELIEQTRPLKRRPAATADLDALLRLRQLERIAEKRNSAGHRISVAASAAGQQRAPPSQ